MHIAPRTMNTKDNTKAKFIYMGRYQNPLSRNEYSCTPLFKDKFSKTLFIVLTSPGAFLDVYNEAKAIKYVDIIIFMDSLAPDYVSDVFRLASNLNKIDRVVNIYYPMEIPYYFKNITVMENCYVNKDAIVVPIDDGDTIMMKYLPTPKLGVYNIEIHDGVHNFIVCGYVDIPTIEGYCKRTDIDEVHLPYITNNYGGLSFKKIMEMNRSEIHSSVRQKIMINGFHNIYEIQEALEKYKSRMVEVISSHDQY